MRHVIAYLTPLHRVAIREDHRPEKYRARAPFFCKKGVGGSPQPVPVPPFTFGRLSCLNQIGITTDKRLVMEAAARSREGAGRHQTHEGKEEQERGKESHDIIIGKKCGQFNLEGADPAPHPAFLDNVQGIVYNYCLSLLLRQ
jgi:hypothetical protein